MSVLITTTFAAYSVSSCNAVGTRTMANMTGFLKKRVTMLNLEPSKCRKSVKHPCQVASKVALLLRAWVLAALQSRTCRICRRSAKSAAPIWVLLSSQATTAILQEHLVV